MPLIQKILENEAEDDIIRANAIASLDSIGDLRAVDALMAALNSDNITIRRNIEIDIVNYPSTLTTRLSLKIEISTHIWKVYYFPNLPLFFAC